MPFFLSSLLTAPLCSINLCFKFLFVSPTYTFSQSRQGTSYTTLLFNRSGLGVFTLVSFSRRVWCDLKTALTPMREARVVTVEPSYWKRRMREALRIQSVGSTSNLDCGLTLDPVWLQFLDRIRSP